MFECRWRDATLIVALTWLAQTWANCAIVDLAAVCPVGTTIIMTKVKVLQGTRGGEVLTMTGPVEQL